MLENCRWLLYASRLYGCHPHTIRERSATTVTSARTTETSTRSAAPPRLRWPLMLYSVIACGVYCAVAYRASGVLPCVSASAMIVGCALQQLDRYVRTLYMILTPLLSCLRHADFERAVAAARRFDTLTRRYRRRRHAAVDTAAGRRRVQWLVILAIHVAWLLIDALVALSVPIDQVAWFTITVQFATRTAFSMQVAKFYFLYDALRHRFRRLNKLCREMTGTIGTSANTGAFGMQAGRRPTVVDLQRLHRCLSDATNHLSSHYSPQLLCWIACMLTDIVTYVFFVLYNVNSPRMVCVQCLILLYLSLLVVATSRVCHSTCDQANALARTVFSMEATARFQHIEYATEAIELGMHLRAHPLRVKVFGLFDLDSRFAFSAFCIILMYVILASSIH